ncbi:hypothetical protein D9757_015077 [Collybiopsis confluens]|uniref:O-methyltransferase dimerisation domain-containing protein n=1 Tax=Collybiopsis confluens TaxID=2823264 RepID=A0A8H5FNK3_9AGAR|nr:hypothetical protein D9757_015077 [Collybiopsis confluens]
MHIYYLDAYLSTSFRDISTTMSGPTEVKTLLEIINSAALDALAEYDNRGERLPGINEIMLAGTSPHEADLSIKLKKMLRTLEGACGQLCATLAPPLHTIVNNYYWSCLRVAARKQIARILQDTPEGMHISDIAAKVDIQTTKLLIIMRTLAARHCFQELSQDIYTNTRISLVLLSHNNASFIDLLTQEGQKTAGNLEEYLSNPVYGPSSGPEKSLFMYGLKESGFQGNLYDWMTINPKRREIMGESMTSMNKVMGTLSILDGKSIFTVKIVLSHLLIPQRILGLPPRQYVMWAVGKAAFLGSY